MSKRPTSADRAAKRQLDRSQAWAEFSHELATLGSAEEARALIGNAPPPDSPGRPFYSNFANFFGNNFVAPGGASADELILYIGFIERLVAAGQVRPEDGTTVIEGLRKAPTHR